AEDRCIGADGRRASQLPTSVRDQQVKPLGRRMLPIICLRTTKPSKPKWGYGQPPTIFPDRYSKNLARGTLVVGLKESQSTLRTKSRNTSRQSRPRPAGLASRIRATRQMTGSWHRTEASKSR